MKGKCSSAQVLYLGSDGQVKQVGDTKLLHHLLARATAKGEVALAILGIKVTHVLDHRNTGDLQRQADC